ncbi:Plant self-incompatibility S1 [Arabidopsis suecica]|uniref:S-protein homolog n=1 Tax=Arabidopsis suecica TaxID=45249 RepID=A0A8T2BTF8_ARASU|nr:Plant self-incompatibility S1 [Arabidopsis suecica]
MNQFIVFMLVILMYFCMNEGAQGNILRLKNELNPGSILKVNCTSKSDITGVHDVTFNSYAEWSFGEHETSRTIWRCLLRQGPKMEFHHILWRAYRGARFTRNNQIRLWIAKVDGIYLEKNNGPRKRMYDWYKA